jgi:integrative and conjugative element protein (TIGR02256 family)
VCEALVFQAPSGERLEVKPSALAELRRGIQVGRSAPEGGGILVGRRILDSADLVVDCVTSAFPTDARSRHSFTRNPTGHQGILDRVWAESGGVATYLGEWHTHPSAGVSPSAVDWLNWRRLQRRSNAPLVFLIVGTELIGCWGRHGRWRQEGQ